MINIQVSTLFVVTTFNLERMAKSHLRDNVKSAVIIIIFMGVIRDMKSSVAKIISNNMYPVHNSCVPLFYKFKDMRETINNCVEKYRKLTNQWPIRAVMSSTLCFEDGFMITATILVFYRLVENIMLLLQMILCHIDFICICFLEVS